MAANRFNFRFFHFEDKKMYNVLQLCSKFPDEDFLRVFIDKPIENEEQFTNWKVGIDGELMQSIGLLDKNGKEIFTGDILKRNTKFYKVIFDEYCPSFCLVDRTNYVSELDSDFAKKAEVAGNVFQNLELMK